MAGLVVLLIILGCAAYQYTKGKFVRSLAMIIVGICASIVAFGYFEVLAAVLISRDSSDNAGLVCWAQPLSFILLFVLAFAILQTVLAKLTSKPVDLGLWPERVGRVVCGIFLGLILSGVLLTAMAMSPLPNKYPYQRFDDSGPDPEKPNKVFLNADGFVTGWFSLISNGSFSGKRSFATIHPAFIDQAFLNRHNYSKGVSITTSSEAIEVQRKNAAWIAPEGLKDAADPTRPIASKTGTDLIIVRIGIKRRALKDAGRFRFSQLRLICKPKSDSENTLSGRGKNIYPAGYLKTAGQLELKRLDEVIELKREDFTEPVKWIDFAFYVPKGHVPVLVEFKQNSIAAVPPLVSAEQALPAVGFGSKPEKTGDAEESEPSSEKE